MQATKIYVVSVLITICTLLAAGYSQTSNARPGLEVNNSQDANQNPSNPGAAATTGATPSATNSTIQPAPGQKISVMSPSQRATPVNPAAAGENAPVPATPMQSQAEVSPNVLFEFLFSNISDLNQIASNDEKAGKRAQAALWRSHDQRSAGLNDAEGEILQETALNCLQALKEQDAKIRAVVQKDRAQATPGVIGTTPPELIQLVEDRKKIVNNYVDSLREALGDASFSKLDTYVHSSFHAEVVAPKPAPASITITGKSPKESQ